jgi:hypothetical protein
MTCAEQTLFSTLSRRNRCWQILRSCMSSLLNPPRPHSSWAEHVCQFHVTHKRRNEIYPFKSFPSTIILTPSTAYTASSTAWSSTPSQPSPPYPAARSPRPSSAAFAMTILASLASSSFNSILSDVSEVVEGADDMEELKSESSRPGARVRSRAASIPNVPRLPQHPQILADLDFGPIQDCARFHPDISIKMVRTDGERCVPAHAVVAGL